MSSPYAPLNRLVAAKLLASRFAPSSPMTAVIHVLLRSHGVSSTCSRRSTTTATLAAATLASLYVQLLASPHVKCPASPPVAAKHRSAKIRAATPDAVAVRRSRGACSTCSRRRTAAATLAAAILASRLAVAKPDINPHQINGFAEAKLTSTPKPRRTSRRESRRREYS